MLHAALLFIACLLFSILPGRAGAWEPGVLLPNAGLRLVEAKVLLFWAVDGSKRTQEIKGC